MSGSGVLAAVAALLVAAAARDLFRGHEVQLRVPKLLLGKLLGAGCGALLGLIASPVAPGRLPLLVLVGLPAAGFFLPEVILARRARQRQQRLVAALPDALDCSLSAPAQAAAPPPGSSNWRGQGRGRWRRSCV